MFVRPINKEGITKMVTIVERREGDLPALRELFLKVRQDTFTWAEPGSFDSLDFDKETEGEYILVALLKDRLIGFISVWKEDSFIHHLYVDREYKRQGIGTNLLQAIMEKINFPVRLKCLEQNVSALDYYHKRGFISKGTGNSEAGAFILLELESNAQGLLQCYHEANQSG
jgi:ribosomal protein S18 acetylase RimI-like enzyme